MLVCAPMHAHAEGSPPVRAGSFLHRFEGGVLVVAFLLSMAIPLIDASAGRSMASASPAPPTTGPS